MIRKTPSLFYLFILVGALTLSNFTFTSCKSAKKYAMSVANYAHALRVTQTPTPDRVSTTLMPIREDNAALEWTNVDTTRMVLVCKFIDTKSIPIWNRADTFRISTRNGYWVSLPADWERRIDRFEGLDSVAARSRMVEILGLWPECDYDMVVEFYADVNRMFRPAYDPRIYTTTSGTEFPEWVTDDYTVGGVNIRQWIANQQATAYTGTTACPWGQLGYSYDWHSGSSVEGLSEYVVTNNTLVRVKRLQGAWSFIQNLRKLKKQHEKAR